MDNNMMMDFLMKQQEIAAQQNLAFQQSQNSMMQLLAALMAQPQPDPTAQMPTPPNMQQTMALSNAAATPNLAEINDLKAQIEALKQQLTNAQNQLLDMQNQLISANERASAAESRASTAETELANLQAEYGSMIKDVSLVEAANGRTLAELAEEAGVMTGQDYYDKHREELEGLSGQEAHDKIADVMDAKDEWLQTNLPEKDYEDITAKRKERRAEQYAKQHDIVNFTGNMVDMGKQPQEKPKTDKEF